MNKKFGAAVMALPALLLIAISWLVLKPAHRAPPSPAAPNPDLVRCIAASPGETIAAANATLAACARVIADKAQDPGLIATARAAIARASLAKARAETAAQDFPDVLKDATTALPAGGNAYFYRGVAEDALGEYAHAVTDEAAFLAGNKDDWRALYWKGYAESRVPNLAAAASDFAASSQINPGYAPALAEAGLVAAKRRDIPTAIYDETLALSLFNEPSASADPSYPAEHAMAFATRSTAELQLFRYVDAKTDARAAIDLGTPGPWRAEAFRDLGYVELKSADYTDAADALTQALALSPGNAQIEGWLEAAQRGPRTKK